MPCGSSDSRRRAEHRSALLRTRICRRCSGEGSASYSLHISRPPGRRDSGRFMEAFQKTLHRQSLGRSPAGMRAQRTSPAVKYMRRGHVPFVSAFQEPEPGLFERFHIRADDDHVIFGILAPPRTPRGISAWFPRTWDSRGRATGYPRPAPTPNRIRRILRQPGRGSFRMFRRP